MSGKINAIDQLRLSLNILSREDVLKIHTATLDVIESIGVRFPSHKALNILEAHGATVDRETMIAKIPGRVVEDALKTAPPIYTLAARDPSTGFAAGRPARLPRHRRLLHRSDRCLYRRAPPHDEERLRRLRACGRCAGRSRLLVVDGRGAGSTAGVARLCTNWKRRGATPPSTCRPRASSPSRRCAPRSRWRRRSWAARTNCASGPSFRSCSARPVRSAMTAVQPRCGLARRRGGLAGRLHDDGVVRLQRPGDDGGQSRRGQRRSDQRAGLDAARASGRAGLLRGGADRDGFAHGRLHGRRAGRFSLRRGDECAERFLQRAAVDGRVCDRR